MLALRTLVLFSLAVAVFFPTIEAAAVVKEPKKCCFPEQFTIFKGATVGTVIEGVGPIALFENQDAAFDFKNNKIGANITRVFYTGQPSENFRIVEDITKKSLWVILPDKKQCTKETIEDFPLQCIPENATYSGSIYFGNKGMYADSWYFYMKNYLQTSGFYTLTVAADGSCIPFGDTFVGTSTAGGVNQEMVATSGYYNYTQGIGDPERYFNLPDYCTKTPRKLTTLMDKTKHNVL